MKKITTIIVCLLFISTTFAQFKVPPKSTQYYVHDYENLLTKTEIESLDQTIREIKSKSSIEIAIVILNDLQGYEIEDAAFYIGRDWGVGQKQMDNGLVYLVSPKNRKARIEVGYGLEGDLPDITTKDIGDQATAYYKKEQYFDGIKLVLTKIGDKLNPILKQQKAEKEKLDKERDSKAAKAALQVFIYFVLFIVFGLLVFYLIKISNKYKKLKKRIKTLHTGFKDKLDSLEKTYGFTFLEYELGGGDYSEFKKLETEIRDMFVDVETNKISIRQLNNYNSKVDDFEYKLSHNDIYRKDLEHLKKKFKEYNSCKKYNIEMTDQITNTLKTYSSFLNGKFSSTLDNLRNRKSEIESVGKFRSLNEEIIKYLTYSCVGSDLFEARIKSNQTSYMPLIIKVTAEIVTLFSDNEVDLKAKGKTKNEFINAGENRDYEIRYNNLINNKSSLEKFLAVSIPSSIQYKERVAEEKRQEELRKKREAEEAERRRRRQQEEEEEARRRRNSSWDSGGGSIGGWSGGGGSSDSGSSYSGGSFGGGGSTSDW